MTRWREASDTTRAKIPIPARRGAEDRKPAPLGRRQEPRAGDHVEAAAIVEPLEQLGDVLRVVLAVAVELHRDLVAVLLRVHVSGLHGAADPEVERQADDLRTGGRCCPAGPVGGAVVDHEHVELGRAAPNLLDRARDRLDLVERGDDRQIASARDR